MVLPVWGVSQRLIVVNELPEDFTLFKNIPVCLILMTGVEEMGK